MDSSVATYIVTWRKRKWWWPNFGWSLSIQVWVCVFRVHKTNIFDVSLHTYMTIFQAVNAWRLRQRFTGIKDPYLNFLRELIMCLLKENGTPPLQVRRTLEIPASLQQEMR